MLESLFNKVKTASLLNRDSNTSVSCEYCEIFRNTYFMEHLRWLLLSSPVAAVKTDASLNQRVSVRNN